VAISVDEALSSYGFVYTLANNVPDLKNILNQAISGGWTADKLTATIESSPWWNTHSDTVRNLVTSQATDPATYNQNLAKAMQIVSLKAQQLGRVMDQGTLQRLGYQTLIENSSFDDQLLGQLVTNNSTIFHGEPGAYLGNAAQLNDHMKQLASNYGVPVSTQWLDAMVNQVQSGRDSLDGFESIMRARAKAAFPHFANQIDAGMTIRDIADPYISTYAQTLEVPETQVTLKDSYIQKALSSAGPDGTTRTSMPLWQFQRMLKDDPRYDKTKQAKDDAFSTLNKIGKDFGFVGASA
jgi:hypothetical protein